MRFGEGEPIPAIISVGMATGRRPVTNKDIDIFLGRREGSTERLMNRGGVGIEQRFWVDEQVTSDLCAEALLEAISTGRIDPSHIRSLFVANSSPDMWGVSTAAIVQAKAGLLNSVQASTNSDACTGFLLALQRAYNDLASPYGSGGLSAVIGAEIMSRWVGRDDGNSHPTRRKESIGVLVGDGAGAVTVKMVTPDEGAPTKIGFAFGADGKYADELGVEAGGSGLPISVETVEQGRHYVHMNGAVIFEQAVSRMTEATRQALDNAGIPIEEVDYLIPHQANRKIMESVAENLGVPMEKVIMVIREYGNTSSASIPIALHDAIIRRMICRNHIVAATAFGAGLLYGAAVFPMVGLPR